MAKHQWTPEEWWYSLLMDSNPPLPGRQLRRLFGLVPGAPRCKFCNAPQRGTFGGLMRLIGKGPARLTPQFCKQCETIVNQWVGGAEVELSLLFADVRGSTPLAEVLGPARFGQLISRFFAVAGEVLASHHAIVDKLVGDQAAGLFVPGFAGAEHRVAALEAAHDLLHATGHHSAAGPWIPVGIGIHTGVAFVGSVGAEDGAHDVTVLGDPANVAARLASAAAAGEILVSRDAATARLELSGFPMRALELKGKSGPVDVYVLNDQASA